MPQSWRSRLPGLRVGAYRPTRRRTCLHLARTCLRLYPRPPKKTFAAALAELDDRLGEPAKMRALYSSSALVCNVFDYWRDVDPTSIGRALGIEVEVRDVRFEAPLSSGLRGTKPTLDLLLTGNSGLAFGVESKFTEPFQGHKKRVPFADTYFNGEAPLWSSLGLPIC